MFKDSILSISCDLDQFSYLVSCTSLTLGLAMRVAHRVLQHSQNQQEMCAIFSVVNSERPAC